MKAGQNVDPKNIMSEQEVHEFGIDVIYKFAQQEGYEIVAGSIALNQIPQLVVKKNG